MTDGRSAPVQPPGFTATEWDQAVRSGRAIEIDVPPRRVVPAVLRPFAALAWFLGLWLRSTGQLNDPAHSVSEGCQESHGAAPEHDAALPAPDRSRSSGTGPRV